MVSRILIKTDEIGAILCDEEKTEPLIYQTRALQ